MNRYHTIINILISGWFCCSCMAAEFPAVEKARRRGAQAKLAFHVVDSAGNPVDHAKINAYLTRSDSHLNDDIVNQLTDIYGLAVAMGRSVSDMTYTLTKDGYYKTTGRHWFYRDGENCVSNGRWQPWGYTNTVILKEHRNPVAMIAKTINIAFPFRDKAVGFDLDVGDWVSPYGEGDTSDVTFSYSSHLTDDILVFSNRLGVSFQGEGNGFIRMSKDSWSEYVFAYEAPLKGYIQEMVLSVDRTRIKILKRNLFGPEEYLIIRIRTVLDENGDIISARYGIVDGPIQYGDDENGGGVVQFRYWLNPTSNDRNLEHD